MDCYKQVLINCKIKTKEKNVKEFSEKDCFAFMKKHDCLFLKMPPINQDTLSKVVPLVMAHKEMINYICNNPRKDIPEMDKNPLKDF